MLFKASPDRFLAGNGDCSRRVSLFEIDDIIFIRRIGVNPVYAVEGIVVYDDLGIGKQRFCHVPVDWRTPVGDDANIISQEKYA